MQMQSPVGLGRSVGRPAGRSGYDVWIVAVATAAAAVTVTTTRRQQHAGNSDVVTVATAATSYDASG